MTNTGIHIIIIVAGFEPSLLIRSGRRAGFTPYEEHRSADAFEPLFGRDIDGTE